MVLALWARPVAWPRSRAAAAAAATTAVTAAAAATAVAAAAAATAVTAAAAATAVAAAAPGSAAAAARLGCSAAEAGHLRSEDVCLALRASPVTRERAPPPAAAAARRRRHNRCYKTHDPKAARLKNLRNGQTSRMDSWARVAG